MPKTKTTPKKRGRPTKDPNVPEFRFKGKKIGLTFSCPENARDNPIKNNEELLEILTNRWGLSKYIIAEEAHKSGKRHYHVYMHLDDCLDKTKADFADIDFEDDRPFKHLHPNIIKAPGNGWQAYCRKETKFITNINLCTWTSALSMPDAHKAIEYLWNNKAGDMCKHASQIEANITKRFKAAHNAPKVFFGPYPEYYYPTVDMTSVCVCLWGPPRTFKSQFARYFMAHTYGEYGFAKGSVETLKHIDTGKPFIFDEVDMHGPKLTPADSREITCVEQGGSINARFNNIEIPPGVPRIFTSNMQWPFKNPLEAVYGRRVVMMHIPSFTPKEITDMPQFVEGFPLS